MTTGIYPIISLHEKEIRLVEIHQGSTAEPIVCSLSTATLGENPEYGALSYVCGDAYSKDPVFLNKVPVRIIQNLEVAIRHLRQLNRPMLLWIDALCIDQGNTPERNHQVSIMGEIYRQAQEVYAWLGDLNAEANMILDIVETLGGDFATHWNPNLPQSISKQMVSAGLLRDLCNFFERPWWTRVWTVQEAILPERLIFICGSRQVDASMFFGLSKSFQYHNGECCGRFFLSQDRSIIRDLRYQMDSISTMEFFRCARNTTALLQQMAFYRTRCCKEPKDKVYAFLGWGDPRSTKDIKPDYSLSDASVYEELASKMIMQKNDLSLLAAILPEQSLRTGAQIKDLPSWVPDWSISVPLDVLRPMFRTRQPHSQLRQFQPSGPLKVTASYQNQGKLTLQGIILGTIEFAGEALKRSEMGATTISVGYFKIVQQWRSLVRDGNAIYRSPSRCTHNGSQVCQIHLSTPETSDDAFWEILCAYLDQASPDGLMIGDEYLFRDLQRARESYQEAAEFLITSTKGSSTQRIDSYLSQIIISISSRRFFASRNPRELLGLVPFTVQLNDQIAMFSGSDTLHIIRKSVDTGKQEWTYVGEAYVHGFMDGEALELGDMQAIILV